MTLLKKNRILSYTLLIILIVMIVRGCIVPITNWLKFNQIDSEEAVVKLQKDSVTYLNLFSPKIRQELQLDRFFISKNNSAIMTFDYKDRFSIIVHKLKADSTLALSKIVKTVMQKQKDGLDGIYQGYEETGMFKMLYSSQDDPKLQQIVLKYDGELTATSIRNKDIVEYQFSSPYLSISYGSRAAEALIFNNLKDESTNWTFHVSFVKDAADVFVLVSIPWKLQESVPSDFFESIGNANFVN